MLKKESLVVGIFIVIINAKIVRRADDYLLLLEKLLDNFYVAQTNISGPTVNAKVDIRLYCFGRHRAVRRVKEKQWWKFFDPQDIFHS